MRHIIVTMPIETEMFQWAENTYPHLIIQEYSPKRNQYLLLSRALLQKTLLHNFNIHHLPMIGYHEHGKPYFIDYPEINFNITHTDNTLAIIIAECSPVGIDIETIKIRRNFSKLENRVLDSNEQLWLKEQDDYLKSFFALWSAKEAYLKATGTGLSGLSTLQLDLKNNKAYGPLKTGNIYINQSYKDESFALYLPKTVEPNLYSFNGSNFLLESAHWNRIECFVTQKFRA